MNIKNGSTLFLKIVVILMGLAVLALCIFVLPRGIMLNDAGGYRPILLGMYIPAIPFFIALSQALKLLSNIDKNKAFSKASIKALSYIKYCTVAIGSLYALGLPYIFKVADRDDAPGVVLLALIFTFAPLVIAVFAAIIQKVFQNAIDMKSENELTV